MIRRLFYIIIQRLYVLKNKDKPCHGKVYMLHDISDNHDTYSITPEGFKSFLNYLINNRKISEVGTLLNEADNKNAVLTFDDAYENVYKHAYPLLKENDIPYYVFICDEYMGKEGYLDIDMLIEMVKNSRCIVGSHGLKHELSRFIDDEKLRNNLKRSKMKLQEELRTDISTFAFPYGSMYACSKENISIAKDIFDYVFMTYNLPYNKEYQNVIPRININDSTYKKEMI